MKILIKITLRAAVLIIALCGLAAAAYGQDARLRIDNLDRLEDKAVKVVDVTLDQNMMNLAMTFLAKQKGSDAARVREVVGGIRGIYVKSFEFENEGAYSPGDVEPIRAQLKGPGWSRMVGVRSKKDGDNAEVYMLMQGDKVGGLAIIAANPKELTIVNIVGTIDIDKLSDLDGNFGIPDIRIEHTDKTPGKP